MSSEDLHISTRDAVSLVGRSRSAILGVARQLGLGRRCRGQAWCFTPSEIDQLRAIFSTRSVTPEVEGHGMARNEPTHSRDD